MGKAMMRAAERYARATAGQAAQAPWRETIKEGACPGSVAGNVGDGLMIPCSATDLVLPALHVLLHLALRRYSGSSVWGSHCYGLYAGRLLYSCCQSRDLSITLVIGDLKDMSFQWPLLT